LNASTITFAVSRRLLEIQTMTCYCEYAKEAAMSDLTLIAEDILNAMQAVEEAHNATQALREKNNHAAFDAFRAKMIELHDHLSKLKMVLDNEEAFAMDELMDAMSKVYSGHRADYRKTPRMNE
jgi:hypothetical protein